MTTNNQTQPSSEVQAFQARWILPISRPPIENGIITIQNGQILQVEPVNLIKNELPKPPTDLGDSVIFPGFINAHTHLEHGTLSECPTSFINYTQALRTYNLETPDEQKSEEVNKSIEECFRFGTVALADLSCNGISYQPLLESHLYARVFHELHGFKSFNSPAILEKHLGIIKSTSQQKKVTSHLAPSSIWSASQQLFYDIGVHERHMAIHLAMSKEESEFTLNGNGKLRQFLLSIGDYDYNWKTPGLSPVRYFFFNHFFSRHNILVHMVHVTGSDIDTIKEYPTKANICLCPRSDELLSLGTAPARLFLEKGLNICLGTESRSSVPDIDIRKEILKCVELYSIPPDMTLKFATINGAYAIGFHQEVGSLDPGKTAKCLVLKCGSSDAKDPYNIILESNEEIQWLI